MPDEYVLLAVVFAMIGSMVLDYLSLPCCYMTVGLVMAMCFITVQKKSLYNISIEPSVHMDIIHCPESRVAVKG